MKKLLLFVTFLISGVCCSQDNPLEDAVKKAIDYKDEDYHNFVVKELPNNPALAICCAAKFSGEVTEDGFDCDLILLLFDVKTQKIIDRYREEKAYVSDAYALSEIGLDLANYKVDGNYRAFGVRNIFSASSRVYPSWAENLSLFIIKNNKIVRILDELEVASGNGDWDTNCHYDGEEIKSVLIMQQEMTNGFFDIKVKTIKTIRKNRLDKKGDCIESKKYSEPTYQILEYANGEYKAKKKAAAKPKKK